MFKESRLKNKPTPLDSPTAERGQEIHSEHVEIVIVGDLDTDILALDAADRQRLCLAAANSDYPIAGADELGSLRRHLDAGALGNLEGDRGHGRAAVDEKFRPDTVHLTIDPEVSVERHRDTGFLALLDRRAKRLSLDPLSPPREIVAKRQDDNAGSEDRD